MKAVLDYVLERPVGHGPDTVVHRARRLPGDEPVALKRAAPDLTGEHRALVDQRLRREAAALRAVSHPALVPLVEVLDIPIEQGRLRRYGTDPGPRTELGLVLAWAARGSLADAIGTTAIEPRAVGAMAHQVAGALAALHAAGIVHGDVAPGNVLRADERAWWLADLGESHRNGCVDHDRRRGTDGFVAPEVLDGAPGGPAADVFGWGCVVAAALGRSPDGEPGPLPRSPVSGSPVTIDRLVRRAISRDPSARPTAPELEQALRGVALGDERPPPPQQRRRVGVASDAGPITRDFDLPPMVPPPPPAGRPPCDRRPRHPSAAISIGAGAAVIVVLLAAVLAWPRSAARPVAASDPEPTADTLREPSASAVPRDDREPERGPCPGSSDAAPPGAVPVPGDPVGAGCDVMVLWWPDRAEVERPDPSGARLRFSLGRPGDQLLLGDWDGDGLDTAALYDPATGTVTRFDGWARADQPLVGSVVAAGARTHGIAHVRRLPGPDEVDVDPAPP